LNGTIVFSIPCIFSDYSSGIDLTEHLWVFPIHFMENPVKLPQRAGRENSVGVFQAYPSAVHPVSQ
jgi:hypothetical protein